MRSSLVRRALPAVVVALGLALSGCIKSETVITVYPDGSGKVDMKQTLMGMLAQMARTGGAMGGPMGGGEEGGAPQAKPDPYEMLRKSVEGKVYWTNLKTADGPGGEYIISGTGYFEDVNQIKPEKGTYSFKKTDEGGHVFEMTQELPDEMKGGGMPGMPPGEGEGGKPTPEQEAQQKQMMEMMKGMLAGFDMKVEVVMPGAVKAAEGMKAGDGRKAAFHLGEEDVKAIMEKKLTPPTQMKVTSNAPAGLDAELAAFKKELAAAKEADAKAPSKPAEPPAPVPAGDKKEEPKKDEPKKDF